MSEGERPSDDDKQHAPTQQKLRRSREQGEVAYSTEITAAATYAAFYVAIVVAGGWSALRVADQLAGFFRRPEEFGALLTGPSSMAFVGGLTASIAGGLSPLFGALALAAVASLLAQRAIVFAPSRIKPKWQRLSLIDNAKQKYGPQGLFEFAKSFVKLGAIILILTFALTDRFLELPQLSAFPAQAFGGIVFREAVYFLGFVTIAAAAIAAVDMPWRIFSHEKKLRMTHEELKKEGKENEGDPHVKQARRERGAAIARNRMLADVPKASVVIVNPTHYAVALAWDRETGAAPVCVAKGVDEIAAKIREIAASSGVPIRRDPPTARAIHASVEVGKEIRKEHYAAVAAAIHYADEIVRKSKQGYAP